MVSKWLAFSAGVHFGSCAETQLHLAIRSMYRNGGMALPNPLNLKDARITVLESSIHLRREVLLA